MTDEEMLAQISGMFEARDARLDSIDARFDVVDAEFAAIDAKFDAIDARFDAFETRMMGALDAHYTKVAVLIDNTVMKRLDSLFDGYMLSHEKQTEIETRVDSLEERVETLENQAS